MGRTSAETGQKPRSPHPCWCCCQKQRIASTFVPSSLLWVISISTPYAESSGQGSLGNEVFRCPNPCGTEQSRKEQACRCGSPVNRHHSAQSWKPGTLYSPLVWPKIPICPFTLRLPISRSPSDEAHPFHHPITPVCLHWPAYSVPRDVPFNMS